jgi:hypothetical protein
MANLKFSGRITKIGETVTGSNSKGEWTRTNIIVEEDVNEYPNAMTFDLFNKQELVDKLNEGDSVEVLYNSKVSEFNGKSYNSLSVWKIDLLENGNSIDNIPEPPKPNFIKSEANDDIPF